MKTLITSIALSLVASIASAETECKPVMGSYYSCEEAKIEIKETNRIIHSYTGDLTTVIKEKTARQVAAESMLEAGIGGLDGRPSR